MSTYFNFLPSGYGGASSRAGSSVVEAQAALKGLAHLPKASDGDLQDHINYLEVRGPF